MMEMSKSQAIHNFWSRFGVPAYDENSVPEDVQYPYITYNLSTDSLGGVVSLYASIWDRSTSWKKVTNICGSIAEFIGYGHHTEKFDGGYVYMTKGTPFAQRMNEPGDDLVKRIYINLEAEFLCEY